MCQISQNKIGNNTTASKSRDMPGSTSTSTDDYSILNETKEKEEISKPRKIIFTILWLILTYISKEFAKFLSIHQSQAATLTFIPAFYQYDDENTSFDNTFLTYGTDYMLSIFMFYASYKCYSTNMSLGRKGSALFASYAISVFSGGYAHSTYTSDDIDSMNTLHFRIIWILCVGTVTAAGGFMGMCGSEIAVFFQQQQSSQSPTSPPLVEKRFPLGHIVSNSLWWVYGLFMTIICIMGEISYKRPACDIFVAGTTQFVPTVYCLLSLLFIRWNDAIPGLEGSTRTTSTAPLLSRKLRTLFYIGFALNTPLLPSYPLLVQYTNISLGVVNALLHLNLTLAWGMQAWSIYHVCMMMKK